MKLEKSCLKYWLALASFLFVVGCTHTYIPPTVKANQVAFSGNSQNAGFIGFLDNGSGIIDSNARDKYNYFINIYSKKFTPPISKDFGISPYTNSTYLITAEALSKFITMNKWSKNNERDH